MRILVADDSASIRRLLADMLGSCPGWTVTTARDGAEALELVIATHPHVVTLDINMPVMDGLTCLSHIMTRSPCPVIMFSSLTRDGALPTLEALNMGAVDYVEKPSAAHGNLSRLRQILIEKVQVAARARVGRVPATPPGRAHASEPRRAARLDSDAVVPGLVLIGSSTGGPKALEELLPLLPADFPWTVVVAQHIPGSFSGPLAQRLNGGCALPVSEVAQLTVAQPGQIYVAHGDSDLLVSRRPTGLYLLPTPVDPRYLWHPSIERLVGSALSQLPAERLVAVQLTGMGHDGAEGMAELRRRGGHTVAESEDSAVVYGMPGALVERGGAEVILPLQRIADQIRRWV